MKKVTTSELNSMRTLIKDFMSCSSINLRTFSELVEIFEYSYRNFTSDRSNDLRILNFSKDMESGGWNSGIEITIKERIAVDGIHRGIAYLMCIKKGIPESKLPIMFLVDEQSNKK